MQKKILLLEDSVTMKEVIAMTLSRDHYHIETVSTVEQALVVLRGNVPDLILADTSMGDEPNGYDLCNDAKEFIPHTPIILLHGSGAPFDAARALEVGADGNIAKPFESGSLIKLVDEVLAKAASQSTFTDAQDDVATELATRLNDSIQIQQERKRTTNEEKVIADETAEFDTEYSQPAILVSAPPPRSVQEEQKSNEERARPTMEFQRGEDITSKTETSSLPKPAVKDGAEQIASQNQGREVEICMEAEPPRPGALPLNLPSFDIYEPQTREIPRAAADFADLNNEVITETIEAIGKETIEKLAQEIIPEIARRIVQEQVDIITSQYKIEDFPQQ